MVVGLNPASTSSDRVQLALQEKTTKKKFAHELKYYENPKVGAAQNVVNRIDFHAFQLSHEKKKASTFAKSRRWQSIAAIATCSYKVHSTPIRKEEKGQSNNS